jgi:hypothetical protein
MKAGSEMQVKRGGEGGGLLPELNVDQGEEASKRAEEEISVDCKMVGECTWEVCFCSLPKSETACYCLVPVVCGL